MDVGATQVLHDELHRLQEQIDAFLLAHDADVTHEIFPAVFELGFGGHDLHARQIGA